MNIYNIFVFAGNAWKLQGDLKQGVCTSLYVDNSGYLAVGTSSGAISVWDLRFLLPITHIAHPNGNLYIFFISYI